MRKTLILMVILLYTIITADAASQNAQLFDKIENSLYGYTYSNDNDQTRLNRIEETVYGNVKTGQMQGRISKLKEDLSADLIGQEIEPKENTFADDDESWVFAKEPAEASKMDYPVIDEMEKEVFKKENKGQNIKTRLTALETKMFGKSYENDDLYTRTERLKAKIKPNNFVSNILAKQENNFYNGDIGKFDQNYHLDSYGDTGFDYDSFNNRQNQMMYPNYSDYDDMMNRQSYAKPSKPLNISTIEKTLYKKKFEDEPMPERLSRIESSVFGTTFASDSDSERIERISSAIQAQKSARRYDSNKFSQNMATAFQIGTLILMVLACIL